MFFLNHSLSVRITARDDDSRATHANHVMDAMHQVIGGSTLTNDTGAWQGERGLEKEPSWAVIGFTNDVLKLVKAIQTAVVDWMIECRQECAMFTVDNSYAIFIQQLEYFKDGKPTEYSDDERKEHLAKEYSMLCTEIEHRQEAARIRTA